MSIKILNRISLILACATIVSIYSCSLQPSIPPTEETPQGEYSIDNLPGCDNCTGTINDQKLAQLAGLIRLGFFGDIHSLIIIHNDDLVLEEYFRGWTRHMRHPMMSTTKSVISALIGIAIDKGYINGVDEKLLSFFPEYAGFENTDERKISITLEHVLTMASGLSWNETTVPYTDRLGRPNPENDVIKMTQSEDYIKYILDRPMDSSPGTQFVYSSGGSHLLSGIVQNSTGTTAEQFAADNIFGPLGITDWEWSSDPQGRSTGGWGLSLHPVDLAIFGYLYLNGGRYKESQIIPEQWFATSTARHITASIQDVTLEYGYQWWRITDEIASDYLSVNDMFYTAGAGGQHAFVIPHLNLVVATTAENFNNQGSLFTMLFEYILPAIEEK